jgi:hypothetical protein
MAPGTLTQLARGKTRKVQRQLKVAEDELREANATLLEVLPEEVSREVGDALRQASAAEDKVREAEAELEVVSKLLTVEAGSVEDGTAALKAQGSGEGTRSLLPHIDTDPPPER